LRDKIWQGWEDLGDKNMAEAGIPRVTWVSSEHYTVKERSMTSLAGPATPQTAYFI